jgi:hypothetical protein
MKGPAMRPLLFSLVVIVTASAAGAALYSTVLKPPPMMVVPEAEYRFADRFCRAQYNNPLDRDACMMRATGMPLDARSDGRDDR